jgi:hypothetical protein
VGVLGKVTTRPLPSARGQVDLTPAILAQHFRATAPEHIVGLHTTSPDNLSRWGAVEVDRHGDGGNTREANLAAALAWYGELVRRGFRPLLTDSNGAGGFHLRFLLAEPVSTPRVFAFLKRLTADYARQGLTAPPEVFPKQRRIEAGRYGNWLRLPGRHHTIDHWSGVWDGRRWLDGARATAFLLGLRGDKPGLIPADDLSAQPRVKSPTAPRTSSSFMSVSPVGQVDLRINAYLDKLPAGLGEGQHRDDHGFRFAAFLVRDLRLPDADALLWMERWDARNAVPKGTDRLRELLQSAHSYGRHAYGSGLRREPPRRHKRHPVRHLDFTVVVEVER